MNKKLFLPALALTFATMGAMASVALDDNIYYPAGDSNCSQIELQFAPCPEGTAENCVGEGETLPYYYSPNGVGCEVLKRNIVQ